MKTKFDSLLCKLKQDIQLCEKEMMQVNALITQTQQTIQDLIYKMEQIIIPNSGDITLIKELYANKKAFLLLIDSKQEKLSSLKYQKSQKENQYKFHQLEFEKIQYLRQKDIQLKMDALKHKETKEFDEISSTRFYQQTRGEV